MFSGPLIVLIAPPQWPFCLLKCNSQTAIACPAHYTSSGRQLGEGRRHGVYLPYPQGLIHRGKTSSSLSPPLPCPYVLTCHLLSMSPQRLFSLRSWCPSFSGVICIRVPVWRKFSSLTRNNFSLFLVSLTVPPHPSSQIFILLTHSFQILPALLFSCLEFHLAEDFVIFFSWSLPVALLHWDNFNSCLEEFLCQAAEFSQLLPQFLLSRGTTPPIPHLLLCIWNPPQTPEHQKHLTTQSEDTHANSTQQTLPVGRCLIISL